MAAVHSGFDDEPVLSLQTSGRRELKDPLGLQVTF